MLGARRGPREREMRVFSKLEIRAVLALALTVAVVVVGAAQHVAENVQFPVISLRFLLVWQFAFKLGNPAEDEGSRNLAIR